MRTIEHTIHSVMADTPVVLLKGARQTGKTSQGKQFHPVIVLYLGDRVIPFVEKLWLVPVHALWAP